MHFILIVQAFNLLQDKTRHFILCGKWEDITDANGKAGSFLLKSGITSVILHEDNNS
ncbi:hypothetical protein N288_03350 [Bacillus infantis NRRL B-14911]|uniref:Uncharacterized protein n=1 Tax=Bacillus infantis NRRL B-14911 TaxID=1367477 RepID=U5L5K4_9BACI|nr:hypothetical protein N288_03350 [Bacillus infantis NRRL B-14911]